jgi:hypothetical protein
MRGETGFALWCLSMDGSSGMNIGRFFFIFCRAHCIPGMVIANNHLYLYFPCYMGPCHHGMARPLVAGGSDVLQMWKVKG